MNPAKGSFSSRVRNWDKDGTLKALRIGKHNIRRWKKTDALKLIKEGQNLV